MPPDSLNALRDLEKLPEITRLNALLAEGDVSSALAAATAAARQSGSAPLLAELARWRLQAYDLLPQTAPRPDWPPACPDPFPGERGVPVIDAADLTPALLGGAVQHHGSLHVRGLITADKAACLRDNIDSAFAARDAHHAGQADPSALPWYSQMSAHDLEGKRQWVEEGGGVWSADSPRNLADLIELFETTGVIATITAYLGERPALSLCKSTLRRVPITSGADWHQDGAFLGETIRSMNVWLALSDCGRDAPGLDIVDRRLPYIVQGGSHGAYFWWSVGQGMVNLLEQGGAQVVTPEFRAGDALLFDHMMLHRTSVKPGMTKTRWAVESWFFAPSTYPMEQRPLIV